MSSEGKKKRGEAGVANAKAQPFRLGGRPCNYSTVVGNPTWSPRGAGSKLVTAMHLAVLLPGFEPSASLIRKTDAAMQRCTSPALT